MIKSFARFFSTHRLIVEQMQQEVVEAALLIDKQKRELNQLREANRFHQLANDSLRRGMKGLRELQDELSQPQHKLSATGKTMIDKKPDGARSPNRYDAVVMAFAPLTSGYDISAYS